MSGEYELRLTAQAFSTLLERVTALEERKRDAVLGSEEQMTLASDIAKLTVELTDWAHRESELAVLVAKSQPTDSRPAALVPPRDLAIVLEEWRAAERELAATTPGSAGWEQARADVERLRAEYARGYQERND